MSSQQGKNEQKHTWSGQALPTGPGYAYTLPPTITCCVLSSKVTFCPVWIAATFMQSAMEWLYPASIGALGVWRERTHSIQLRMLAEVCGSLWGSASVETLSAFSTREKLCSRLGFMPISAADLALSPPVGVTVCLSMSIMPP